MKFSLIGTGFIMPRHAEAIYSVGGRIRDIVNTAHGADAWRTMVAQTDADCIVVLTPNDLHFEMVKTAAESGKIVLCEKPLTIASEDARKLGSYPNVFTVLQLRYHPLVRQLKERIAGGKAHEIEMDISMHRDERYYRSWKGMEERSGGVLFNLGIHYFDLLLHVFGAPKKVKTEILHEKTGTGTIEGGDYVCRWKVSADESRERQRRVFKVDGTDFNFSSKDNLSYENLHREVYHDLLRGKGVLPEEAARSIQLVEALIDAART